MFCNSIAKPSSKPEKYPSKSFFEMQAAALYLVQIVDMGSFATLLICPKATTAHTGLEE
jgi:hypothetical protein